MGIIASALKKVGEALGWVADKFLAALGWVKDKIGAFILSFLFSKSRTAGKENPGKRDAPGDADAEKLLRSLLDPLLEGMREAPGDADAEKLLRCLRDPLLEGKCAAAGDLFRFPFNPAGSSSGKEAGKENPGKRDASGDGDADAEQMLRCLRDLLLAVKCGAAGDAEQLLLYLLDLLFTVVSSQFDVEAFLIKY